MSKRRNRHSRTKCQSCRPGGKGDYCLRGDRRRELRQSNGEVVKSLAQLLREARGEA